MELVGENDVGMGMVGGVKVHPVCPNFGAKVQQKM